MDIFDVKGLRVDKREVELMKSYFMFMCDETARHCSLMLGDGPDVKHTTFLAASFAARLKVHSEQDTSCSIVAYCPDNVTKNTLIKKAALYLKSVAELVDRTESLIDSINTRRGRLSLKSKSGCVIELVAYVLEPANLIASGRVSFGLTLMAVLDAELCHEESLHRVITHMLESESKSREGMIFCSASSEQARTLLTRNEELKRFNVFDWTTRAAGADLEGAVSVMQIDAVGSVDADE